MNRSTISRGPVRTGGRLASFAAMALGLGLGAGESRAQGPRGGEERTVQGRVESLTTAPMGEVDGARLDDGTTIHWPPHLADRFGRVISRGDRVRVSGRNETGPEGDTHFEVSSATNLQTRATVAGDQPDAPAEARPDGADDFGSMTGRIESLQRRIKALEEELARRPRRD